MIIVLVLLILFMVWHVQICWEEEAPKVDTTKVSMSNEERYVSMGFKDFSDFLANATDAQLRDFVFGMMGVGG